MTRARVLVASTTFPQYPGDPRGEFLLRHWRARAAAGDDVRVVVPRTAWSHPGVADDLTIVPVPYAPRAWSTLTGRFGILENVRERPHRALLLPGLLGALARGLRGEIARSRPDRLVAHMLLPTGVVVAAVARAFGIPYELYGHGTDVDLALALPAPLRRAVMAGWAGAERVVLPSWDKHARVSEVVGSGVNLAVDSMLHCVSGPAHEGADPGRSGDGILYLGRLIRQKGVDDLISAVSTLAPAPRVDIAGDGPERRRLERMAMRLGVAARFHGFVEGRTKVELLRGACVVCVPSRESAGLSEGAPLVIREAFAYGVPVVATRTGGIPELCREGGRAHLVPPGRPDALGRALAHVLAERASAAGLC